MTLTNPLKKLYRPLLKHQVLKAIRKAPMRNEPVSCVHRINTVNAGDYYCGPHHYFSQLQGRAVDLMDYKDEQPAVRQHFIEAISGHALIIGGGGLLNRRAFQRQMELFAYLAEQGKKTVLWGLGHNVPLRGRFEQPRHYQPDIARFGLVGTRDYNMPGEWVPCVSALHPIFDRPSVPSREVGVVFHLDTLEKPAVLQRFKALEHTSNIAPFEELIAFISGSEKIITDSYHAMYWSMLLGKKVVVVPNSSKFYGFKYPPVFSGFDQAIAALDQARVYDGLLEECRAINYRFAEKAFNYLGI